MIERPTMRQQVSLFVSNLSATNQLGGILLMMATAFSMLIANTTFGVNYIHFWESRIGPVWLNLSIEEWVNDALMAIFFFLAGIEIKREFLIGQLSHSSQAILPAAAALGGIVVPALIYISLNIGLSTAKGWAIPAATDIAFSLAVLSLLGNRIPVGLKVFLTALAVIDDLGAIIIIALFYTESLQLLYLGGAAFLVGGLVALNRFGVRKLYIYYAIGLVLWYCVLQSGIHATVAGVLLALTIPLDKIPALEHDLHKPVNYGILPVFALANTAIVLSTDAFSSLLGPLGLGVYLALVLGKPFGVVLTSFALVRLHIARLPSGVNWGHIIGAGCTAGIGFTISIFLANLSFTDPAMINVAKLAILFGSLSAGILGYVVLRLVLK